MPAAEATADRRAGARARRRLTAALIVLLLAFVVIAALVGAHAGGGLDGRVITWLQHHEVAPVDDVARVLNTVGVWWVMGPITVVAGLALWLTGRGRDAAYLVTTMALSAGLNVMLKLTFRRTPPSGIPGGGVHPSEYAFPSGHTMGATAFAAAFVVIAWPTRWRWPVLGVGLVFAVVMGLSRLVLAVHWPSDVAAGWALGTAVALAVHLMMPAGHGSGLGRARPSPAPGRRRSPRGSASPSAAAEPLEVVFLDWGDTLMVDDGSQKGPMAAWPEVKAVDGAQEALQSLRERYRLIVATNADESDERDVRAALYRVNLDFLVDAVVSSRDVGARKPDPFFFRAALLRAGHNGVPLHASRAVMVGDSWPNDVAGASKAGMRTIWLNPSGTLMPLGEVAPDAEVRALSELPGAVARLDPAATVAPPNRGG